MVISLSKKTSIALALTLSLVYAESTQNPPEDSPAQSNINKWVGSHKKVALKNTPLNLNVPTAFEKDQESIPVSYTREQTKDKLRDAVLSDIEFVKKNGFEKNPAMRTVVADRLYAKRNNGPYFTNNSMRPETAPKKKKK